MQRIAELLLDVRVDTSDAFGVPVDWMEAMAFAWLARETLHHRPGNVPAVTGASRTAVLGAIYTND
jgi:anhydro-N-acetylmuramic acid kinase